MKNVFPIALACLLLAGCERDAANSRQPDNTAVNQRDADTNTVTPLDQSNNSKDIEQVAAIRRAVLDIKEISINGRNVKIISNNGKAVIRGPVQSAAEQNAIQQAAEKVVGVGNVTNETEVK